MLMLMTAGGAVAETAPSAAKLRDWHFGLQGVGTRRDRYDVFGVPGVPPGVVDERGRGAGFLLGYRFGDRFLLELQVTYAAHQIADSEAKMADAEALITGTVLFRQRETLQPFLRGGFGGAGEVLTLGPDGGSLNALGAAAIAGGGLQVRLSSRFSLELEVVATFANFLEVRDLSTAGIWAGRDWQVRESNWGTRSGLGVVVWF